jgi:3'-phosphoadenosine 5'-phosphosulfate sulfotransferase (PAPS reductase)/FAD synthetase
LLKIDSYYLKQKQSLPLQAKIMFSERRIEEFYRHYNGKVYVSFSGGKDSTVLLDIIRKKYPNTKAMFLNTGLEYPEIIKFVKSVDNVVWVKPKMNFKEVLNHYGYPIVSKEVSQKLFEVINTKSDKLRNKRLYGDKNKSGKIPEKWKYLINSNFKISYKCCDALKKWPSRKFEKEYGLLPFIGTMVYDSALRKQKYLRKGCNIFDGKKKESLPLSIWLEKDIWEYIKLNNLKYSSIYDIGYKNTGCMFCMFGVHLEKPNKFQIMKKTHNKLYKYCISNLGIGKVLDKIGVKYG